MLASSPTGINTVYGMGCKVNQMGRISAGILEEHMMLSCSDCISQWYESVVKFVLILHGSRSQCFASGIGGLEYK